MEGEVGSEKSRVLGKLCLGKSSLLAVSQLLGMSRGMAGKGGALTWFGSLMERAVGRVSVKENFTALPTVLPCVPGFSWIVFSMSHPVHFHLTGLFACLFTCVSPMSPQASMDFQVWMGWMVCQAQKALLEHQVRELWSRSVVGREIHNCSTMRTLPHKNSPVSPSSGFNYDLEKNLRILNVHELILLQCQ